MEKRKIIFILVVVMVALVIFLTQSATFGSDLTKQLSCMPF